MIPKEKHTAERNLVQNTKLDLHLYRENALGAKENWVRPLKIMDQQHNLGNHIWQAAATCFPHPKWLRWSSWLTLATYQAKRKQLPGD